MTTMTPKERLEELRQEAGEFPDKISESKARYLLDQAFALGYEQGLDEAEDTISRIEPLDVGYSGHHHDGFRMAVSGCLDALRSLKDKH